MVFGLASLACASARSMPVLIATRALQGVGGGRLVVTAISALGEMFDRKELIRRQIWLTGVTAVSSLAGPPVGGFLAAGPGWRWVFFVNPPLCAIALVLAARGLPRRHRPGALAGFDAPGAVLIALTGGGIVALGSSHALATSPLWAPLVMAGVFAAVTGFVHVERRAASPLIPPALFAVPALARSITVTGLTGIALFGTFQARRLPSRC